MFWRIVKKYIPNSLKTRMVYTRSFAQLIYGVFYDAKRYATQSSACRKTLSKTGRKAILTKYYHMIEKGLSLRTPRPGFGQPIIRLIIGELSVYRSLFGDDQTTQHVVDVLRAYLDFNSSVHFDLGELAQIIQHCNVISSMTDSDRVSATKIVKRSELLKCVNFLQNPEDFFKSRHSVRRFSKEDIPLEKIETAIRMAQYSPSVCNRQSSRTYVIRDPQKKKLALSFQNGNRGFGHEANTILVVTGCLDHFVSPGERNQCWIDGGLVAMSLMYALHSLGYGTCALNWSVQPNVDRNMHSALTIPNNEIILMLIAVGCLESEFNVACSPRKNLNEVMEVL